MSKINYSLIYFWILDRTWTVRYDMYVTFNVTIMTDKLKILAQESVASIRDIQKNPSKALQGITRVVRGGKTVGFFFSNEELGDLLEDIEAFSSPAFKARVKEARREMKAAKTVPFSVMAKRYGVRI